MQLEILNSAMNSFAKLVSMFSTNIVNELAVKFEISYCILQLLYENFSLSSVQADLVNQFSRDM